MGIFYGILSAVGFGSADFIARFSSQRIGAIRTLFYAQFLGAITIGIYLLFSGEGLRIYNDAGLGWIVAMVGVGCINVVASVALYRGLAIGIVSLVSPVSASYSALVVLLSILSGETLTELRLLGVIAAVVGVIVVSITPPATGKAGTDTTAFPSRRFPPGLGLAILAAIGFALTFWLLGFYIIPQLGSIVPVFIGRMTTISMLFLFSRLAHVPLPIPERHVLLPILFLGALDTVGFIAVNVGLQTEQVAVVSVLSAQFSAVTILLAWIFLKERLKLYQWAGVAIILVGILLVSI